MPRRKGQLRRTELKRTPFKSQPDEEDDPPETAERTLSSRRQSRPKQSRGWRSSGVPEPAFQRFYTENEARVTVYTRACLPGEGTARCEWCGLGIRFVDFSVHHRLPRQMGGDTRSVWHPSRLLLLCGSGTTGCHGKAESERTWGYEMGLLVKRPKPGTDPAWWCEGETVLLRGGAPARLAGLRPWGVPIDEVFLTASGTYEAAD